MNDLRKRVFAIAICCFISQVEGASVVEVSTADGLGADTHVNFGGSSNKNSGASIANGVQSAFSGANTTNTNSPFTARPFLRFDLSTLPSGTIVDAYLRFTARFVTERALSVEVFFLKEDDPQEDMPNQGGWTELGIAGANAPTLLQSIGNKGLNTPVGIDANGNTVTTVNDPAPTFVTFFDSADAGKTNLIAALNADSNELITFAMVSNSPRESAVPAFSFWSKEGEAASIAAALAPTLVVTIEESIPIPLPPAAWLLLSAVMLLRGAR
ncbi:MAG: hypothetical protein AAF384_19825 [Pseudomonadota bacterium]